MSLLLRSAVVLFLAACLSGQSLQMAPVAVESGKESTLGITLVPGPTAVLILKWDLVYPANRLVIEEAGIQAGPAARSAEKSIACAGGWKKSPQEYRYRCMMVGGQSLVPGGVVAELKLRANPDAKSGDARVRLENVEAVLPGPKLIQLKPTGTNITVKH